MTKILLVEDTPDLAQVIVRELSASGYQLIHAGDGLSALRRIGQRRKPVGGWELFCGEAGGE